MVIMMITLNSIAMLCLIAGILIVQKEIDDDRHTIRIMKELIRDMNRRGCGGITNEGVDET